MTMKVVQNKFLSDGFVLVKNAIPLNDLNELRRKLDIKYEDRQRKNNFTGGKVEVLNDLDVYLDFPEVFDFLITDKIEKALKEILGDEFYLFPEISIMKNQYGGWHKDTTSIELFGYEFNKEDSYKVLNLAIYLQDNDENGGGLDVVVGSQLGLKDPYVDVFSQKSVTPAEPRLYSIFKKNLRHILGDSVITAIRKYILRDALPGVPLNRSDSHANKYKVESKVGDVVIFDLRLDHKASWPEEPFRPGGAPKYALFMICGAKNESSMKHRKYLNHRAEVQKAYEYLLDYRPPFHIMQKLERHGITLI